MGNSPYQFEKTMAELHILSQAEADMLAPVQCAHCRGVYDIGAVEVTARYADCSVWNSPCCHRTVDDRGETGWTTQQHYTRLR